MEILKECKIIRQPTKYEPYEQCKYCTSEFIPNKDDLLLTDQKIEDCYGFYGVCRCPVYGKAHVIHYVDTRFQKDF